MRLRKSKRRLGSENQIHAAGDRHLTFTAPQALDRQMSGDQRRGTCRVNRDTRAAQIEDVGDSVGDNAECVPGSRVRRDLFKLVVQLDGDARVIDAANADENTRG
mgnify:CR=1 FL=1